MITKQGAQMARMSKNFEALKGEFAATMERYRQLKSGNATLALPEAQATATPDQAPRQ